MHNQAQAFAKSCLYVSEAFKYTDKVAMYRKQIISVSDAFLMALSIYLHEARSF